MDESGEMKRLGPAELVQSLKSATFKTRDQQLDEFLDDAREKFMSPRLLLKGTGRGG